MAEIRGKIGSNFNFSAFKNEFSGDKLCKISPAVIRTPGFSNLRGSLAVRSPAGGGRREVFGGQQRSSNTQIAAASDPKVSFGIKKAAKWWEKGLKPNMKEVTGAADLVESLLTAGDKLVVVDFFSPGCGGCRALHPKICQLADVNPDVQFLQVDYEEHKSMCYSLNIHVLPFFRFYRGAHGRLCSFSCTNATIKKFKDALTKHTTDRCSLGPTKGLEEKELVALGSNRDLVFTYAPLLAAAPPPPPAPRAASRPLPLPRPLMPEEQEGDKLVAF